MCKNIKRKTKCNKGVTHFPLDHVDSEIFFNSASGRKLDTFCNMFVIKHSKIIQTLMEHCHCVCVVHQHQAHKALQNEVEQTGKDILQKGLTVA